MMERLVVLVAAKLAKMVCLAVAAAGRRAEAVAGTRGLVAATEVVAVIVGTQHGLQQSIGRMPTQTERTEEAAGRIAAEGMRMQEAGSAAVIGVEAETHHYLKAATGDAARPVIQANGASIHLRTKRTPLLLVAKAAGAVAVMVAKRMVQRDMLEASPTPPQVAVAQLSFRLQQPAAAEVAMAAQHGQLVRESSSSQLGKNGFERREAVEVTAVLLEAVIGETAAVAAMAAPSSQLPRQQRMRVPQCSKGPDRLWRLNGLKMPLATCPAFMVLVTVVRALLQHRAFWLRPVDNTPAVAALMAFASISCSQHLLHRHLRYQDCCCHDHHHQS